MWDLPRSVKVRVIDQRSRSPGQKMFLMGFLSIVSLSFEMQEAIEAYQRRIRRGVYPKSICFFLKTIFNTCWLYLIFVRIDILTIRMIYIRLIVILIEVIQRWVRWIDTLSIH